MLLLLLRGKEEGDDGSSAIFVRSAEDQTGGWQLMYGINVVSFSRVVDRGGGGLGGRAFCENISTTHFWVIVKNSSP